MEFGDFFGGGEVEENLLIGVKKRSIINSKKIISKIIIRGGKIGKIGRKVPPPSPPPNAAQRAVPPRGEVSVRQRRTVTGGRVGKVISRIIKKGINRGINKAHRRQ